MESMTPQEELLEPRSGRVLGVFWGCTADDLHEVHPDAEPERTDPDVRTLSLAQFPIGGDLPARCLFTFCLDELVSVDLYLAGATPTQVDVAATPLFSMFQEEPRSMDPGVLRYQEGRTRMDIDRLDARIRLEEVPT